MMLRDLLAELLDCLLDRLFRLLDPVLEWSLGCDAEWTRPPEWTAPGVEGTFHYPAWGMRLFRGAPADPSARPVTIIPVSILFVWSIPLPPAPVDRWRPIRGPPSGGPVTSLCTLTWRVSQEVV